ncbi:Holliday junction branch migration DNA helicase RuvB [Candidatus Methylomirabilis limnetica]|uniref:Holliday junction branch migration complex subunit RuvB n=1 Tax=Candidatus Methylomirabilis limnetica TaxID=2033718 RepID=A0A2T4TUR9_9BACT|nr:Holliday junction branch migration DNA helicase RuvB [Candidatus Methylomirabilis limnetica]PTL34855.1 Holliday junction branch migration DNA helicase RuvB [Candidatus Methylomirabilis limnetica]
MTSEKQKKESGPERVANRQLQDEDQDLELSLRPKAWDDYIGQEKVKANLQVFVQGAKARREPLDHLLFYGPPGLGKTSLAFLIASEMGVSIRVTSGPVIERQKDLAAILSSLREHDVLFIDEIHRLNPLVEETLYPAMEDYRLDLIIGQGPSAQTYRLKLPRFTLIGATTRAGLLSSPLHNRFGVVQRLDFYDATNLFRIVLRSAKILGVSIVDDGAWEIARRSRGTPRVANRLLRRVRDFAQVLGDGIITSEVAQGALERLEVDTIGFDEMDRRILYTIIEKFAGGPVGIETIAVAVGEEKETIEDVYEPFLIQQGFLARTPRGRTVTPLAFDHFKLPRPAESQGELWHG